RLLQKKRKHDSYVSIVTGERQPTGRMHDALAYFEEQLTKLTTESPDSLRRVFDTLCQRLEFMCATLENENAYNIFKSLNSTGVPLGPADLIRNFMFMHVDPGEHDDFDRNLWRPLEERFSDAAGNFNANAFSDFFRDFLMREGRYVKPTATFET